MNETISVVIPAHNAEGTIQGTLNSLIGACSQYSLNITVVDDASGDQTAQKAASMESRVAEKGHRIRVLRQETNQGAGSCRNIGAKDSKGKYLYFLDADDKLAPNALDIMANALDGSEADIAMCQYHYVRDPAKEQEGMLREDSNIWQSVVKGSDVAPRMTPRIVRLNNYPWNKLFKSEFYHREGITYSSTSVNNDIAAHWATITKTRKAHMVSEPLVYHYVFQDRKQITTTFDRKRLQIFEALDDAEQHVYDSPETIHAFFHHYIGFSVDVLKWVQRRLDIEVQKDFSSSVEARFGRLTASEYALLAERDPKLADIAFRIASGTPMEKA